MTSAFTGPLSTHKNHCGKRIAVAASNKKNAENTSPIFKNRFRARVMTGEHGSFAAISQPAASVNPALAKPHAGLILCA